MTTYFGSRQSLLKEVELRRKGMVERRVWAASDGEDAIRQILLEVRIEPKLLPTISGVTAATRTKLTSLYKFAADSDIRRPQQIAFGIPIAAVQMLGPQITFNDGTGDKAIESNVSLKISCQAEAATHDNRGCNATKLGVRSKKTYWDD